MAKERGLFRLIFKEFCRSLTPKIPKHTCVGEDYMGTKYFEVERLKNSIRHKPNRYFTPVNKEDFEQEIPAEWEAWLRGRRKVPPTEAEVIANYEMILLKRKNAGELEALYAEQREVVMVDPNAKPLHQHASMNFPVYEEYQNHGRNYIPKPKK